MSASQTVLGRLFQSLGAKWKKNLPPAVDFDILGIVKCLSVQFPSMHSVSVNAPDFELSVSPVKVNESDYELFAHSVDSGKLLINLLCSLPWPLGS